jgi:hypothetical protein
MPETLLETEVRPRIRQDAAFVRAPEGIAVTLGEDSFLVRGNSAYELLNTLVPHLTGERTLVQLCEGLTDAQRSSVVSLVTMLMKRGVVLDHEAPAEGVDLAALEEFAEQASFLEHFGDKGARGFQRFRDARVVVAGDGELGGQVVDSLVRNGSAGARLILCDEHRLSLGDDLAGADLVCLAFSRADPRSAVRLAELCEARGIAYLPAWRLGNELLLGLIWEPATPNLPCWRCLWLRMLDNGVDGAGEFWAGIALGEAAIRPATPVSAPAAAMAGGILAFEVFRHLSGVAPSDLARSMIVLDLEHCTAFRENPAIHPCCYRHPAWGEERSAVADPPKPAVALGPLQHHYVAPRTGIVTRFRDSALRQIPIATAAVEIASLPAAMTSDGVVFGFGAEAMAEARVDALERAVARYALHMLRRIPPAGAGETPAGAEVVPPSQLTSWLGLDGGGDRLNAGRQFGSALEGSAKWLVPLEAVAASPATPSGVHFEPAYDGVATGYSFNDAALRALVDATGHLAVQAVVRDGGSLSPVPPSAIDASERLRFFRRAAEDLGAPVDVYELATDVPVHVAVVVAGGVLERRVTLRAGLTWADAAERALLHACGWAQLVQTGIRSVPPSESPLVDLFRWSDLSSRPSTGRRAAAPSTAEDVVRGLAALGLQPVVVDITPIDLTQQAPVRVTRVLLRRPVSAKSNGTG